MMSSGRHGSGNKSISKQQIQKYSSCIPLGLDDDED
jgi:hypothetical protein